MADSYIDQFETQSYGPYAVDQIKELVLPLDADFKKALEALIRRIKSATVIVSAALDLAGSVDRVTYKAAAGEEDPVATARDTIRRVATYAKSRKGGAKLVAEVLNGETMTSVLRLRPAKLPAALAHALKMVRKHKAAMPEHAAFEKELGAAGNALKRRVSAVTGSRVERQSMTPAVQKAHAEWMRDYGASKLVVEGVLKLHGRTNLMPKIFDDLAEVHRAPGIKDGGKPEPGKPGP